MVRIIGVITVRMRRMRTVKHRSNNRDNPLYAGFSFIPVSYTPVSRSLVTGVPVVNPDYNGD